MDSSKLQCKTVITIAHDKPSIQNFLDMLPTSRKT